MTLRIDKVLTSTALVFVALLRLVVSSQVEPSFGVLQLPQELAKEQPAKGFYGSYDIRVIGLRYKVQVYYWMLPNKKQFYFKSKGSGVDIPWCGPSNYELKDNGDNTYEIIETGPDPHCGEKEQKDHPVKDLKRTWDSKSNTIIMSMQVYTIWPVGWRSITARCEPCDEPECV
eukprot:CAMPEP_0177587710 /NCGR_PEP_ID=MMETSP0419_2-20121207/5807_1 /TAXON_ID=582737 /ORGANISM="Tetraselmis sp., Strain GSL018" /LENGTH=172 /DNA_ID=CAMNT_0019077799 /DNA_START=11 /DNA_END=525 /DNA_ORIENTATION=-